MTINNLTVKAVFIDYPEPGNDYHMDLPLNPYGEKGIHSRWVGIFNNFSNRIHVFREISNGCSYGMNAFNAHSEYVLLETHNVTEQELDWMLTNSKDFIIYSSNSNPYFPVKLADNRYSMFLTDDEIERLKLLRLNSEMQQDWFRYLLRADQQK